MCGLFNVPVRNRLEETIETDALINIDLVRGREIKRGRRRERGREGERVALERLTLSQVSLKG